MFYTSQVVVALDNAGTYEVTVNEQNFAICDAPNIGCGMSKTGYPAEGAVITFRLQVCKQGDPTPCQLTSTSVARKVIRFPDHLTSTPCSAAVPMAWRQP